MTKRLTGINSSLSYLGVNASQPSNFYTVDRAPTVNDYINYVIGDFWLNSVTQDLYCLTNKDAQVATWSSFGAGGGLNTVTTDAGTATVSANNINALGGTNINTSGSGDSVTVNLDSSITVTDITTTNLTVSGTTTLSSLSEGVVQANGSGELFSDSGTNGQILISSSTGAPSWANITSTGGSITITNGANSINLETSGVLPAQFDTDSGSAVPSSGILEIVGGTGIATSGATNVVTVAVDTSVVTTQYDTDSGSATPTAGVLQIVGATGISTSATGNTVTISGAGVGISQIDGNSGNATGSTVNIVTANSTPVFAGVTDTLTLDFGLSNLGVGSSLSSITTGVRNAAYGSGALNAATEATDTVAVGYQSGLLATTGTNNVLVGASSGAALLTGGNNIIVGKSAGSSYTSSESSNLIIGNSGTVSESNTLRIGTTGSGAGQQSNAYIAGISGVDVGSVATVVSISGDHLGQTTITAGSNITVTPGANSITIAASGAAAYSTGSFTPVLTFGGGTTGITYIAQTGYYTKIGNLVAIFIEIRLSSKGSSTGNAYITGLPFSNIGTIGDIDLLMTPINNITYGAGKTSCHAAIEASTNRMYLKNDGSGVLTATFTDSNFANDSVFKVVGTYFST